MHIESLAYRTDLIFPRFDGIVADRGGYLAVQTPNNPGFYWGNFLLFGQSPRSGDLARWTRLFEREFGRDGPVRHLCFGWDSPEGERGDIQPFVDAGFHLEDEVVLTTERARPAARPADVTIRPLEGDADWAAMAALNRAGDDDEAVKPTHAAFKRALRARYRAMVEGGLGVWLGAFAGDRLVGQLGLFAAGELARFQSVETHPEHRRRGVCSTLVAAACRYGFDELGASRLVIVADRDSAAHRIYLACEFEAVERQVGVFRPPVSEQ